MFRIRYSPVPSDISADVVIVVDVLRASTTVLAALEAGAASVHATAEVDAALQMRQQGMLVAGERNGVRVDGFDFGNSPLEFDAASIGGRCVALCSTNGSRAMLGHDEATAFAGCIRNAGATAEAVRASAEDGATILLQGSGQDGQPTEEDAIAAGAIISAFMRVGEVLRFDGSACQAITAWANTVTHPAEGLLATPHGRYLAELGFAGDVRYAAAFNASRNAVALRSGVLTLVPHPARD
ncbi:2-phosphosulfolactate phosphatase [bacterium]|nr:MAG: 2-phosphosulfolactate phosphatase [bacterium]